MSLTIHGLAQIPIIVSLHAHRFLSSTQSVRQTGVRIKGVIDVITETYLAAIVSRSLPSH